MWSVYIKVESRLAALFSDLLLLIVSLRFFFIIIGIGIALGLWRQWLLLLIYVAFLAVAIFLFYRPDEQEKLAAEEAHRRYRVWLVPTVQWTLRLAVAAVAFVYFNGSWVIPQVHEILSSLRTRFSSVPRQQTPNEVPSTASPKTTTSPTPLETYQQPTTVDAGRASADHSAQPPGRPEGVQILKVGDYTFRILTCDYVLSRKGRLEVKKGERSIIDQGGDFCYDVTLDCELPGWTNGDDVTGDHVADVIIRKHNYMAANCCASWQMYTVEADQLKLIADINTGHTYGCPLKDVDNDGVAEFVYTDWTFAYWKTGLPGSPTLRVPLKFQNDQYKFAPDLMKRDPPSAAELARTGSTISWPPGSSSPPPELWAEMVKLVETGNSRSIPAFLEYAWPKERPGRAQFVDEFWGRFRESLYWPELKRLNEMGDQGLPAGVYKAGGEVSAPQLLSKVDPACTEEARRSRVNAEMVLHLVVGEDGAARDINVAKGLGFGLDERAFEALAKWRFRPGSRNGKPVPVFAEVRTNFRCAF
ncbi:MAG: energy transducer TonB [Bryobacterales bacterium]|nr:energy transducer TonB [Bryobacterales bacterium]